MAPSTTCPGCGLSLPRIDRVYDRKFHATAECWATYEDVLAAEYQDAVLFGQVHQLTVDAWSAQHAGGNHPDKSVSIHLTGLCFVLEHGIRPTDVPPRLRKLAARGSWPHFEPPAERGALTVRDVAIAGSPTVHARRVREWAESVWRSWSAHHDAIRALAKEAL